MVKEEWRHMDTMHKISLASVASDAFVIVNSEIMLNLVAIAND